MTPKPTIDCASFGRWTLRVRPRSAGHLHVGLTGAAHENTFALSIAAVLLAACVTMTEPVSMGKDRYMITLNARGGFQSDGELLSRSVQKANEFCQDRGRKAEIADTKTSGVQMWTPQNNQVVFSCI